MRVPLTWLREYCDPQLDVRAIEQRLTLTGTKVEAIHHHGVRSVDGFVVGHVLDVQPHPDADRLRVCTVDLGEAQAEGPATIVCGAPNVAAGQTVAVATPGAVMPDGTKLERAKLRGVVSEGMILAENELEIGAGGEGILVLDEAILDAEFAPGTPLADVLVIATEVLELEITPNRPDCLGVYGVARELHAATDAPLAREPWHDDEGSAGAVVGAEVVVECPDLCPRFTARAFENVTVGPSPHWLKARLMAAGQRPINNVVDITNYAMLLTGQPLHAFDLDRIAGAKLTVRRARDGEEVQTLDGQTRELDSEMVVIDDADGPTSIAGLMGGARSEVAPDTTRVLLEVATWDGPSIHRASWRLGLRSEASSRFEKGLQPEQCAHAQAIATRLMIDCAGARPAPGTIDVAWEPAAPQVLRLREARVEGILGVPVSIERQAEILRALDFASEPASDGLDVTVPALRRDDVTREIDLIEEVARIDGVDRLPATLPARRGAAGMLTHAQRVRRAAEDAMAGRGLHEIVGWSFAEPGLLDRLLLPVDHAMRDVVRLENPLSDAQSIMRPTLLGSLLDAARHNVARNGPDIAIFESGTVYRATAAGDERAADEHHGLGVLLSGSLAPRSWRAVAAPADFFAAKALLAALLDQLHVDWSVQPRTWPFLHPGRSAVVLAGEQPLGFVGELHPSVAGAWDLERTGAFAIDVGKLAAVTPEAIGFAAFPAVPSLRQDLAVTLPDDVAAAQVLASARRAAGEMLANVSVFDVYAGEQVGTGRRSLALALTFGASDRTLTDEDVAPARQRIVDALGELEASCVAESEKTRSPLGVAVSQDFAAGSPRVIVAGATGFAGALAAHLLWRHPRFELVAVTGRSELGRRLDDLYPRYRVPLTIEQLELDAFGALDGAIVAYPHAAAAPTVADLHACGARVVDLSADFRLSSLVTYEQWYGEHPRPDLLAEAVYGLTELHRERIASAAIVANPGCYPTASLLGLAPLARAGLIADVVIDAKQGISGAGRAFDDTTHMSMAGENILPYKVAEHRHTPEIEEQLAPLRAAGGAVDQVAVLFQAHLVPLDQGELADCYVTTTRAVGDAELGELYAAAYENEPFVDVVGAPPGTREVLQTNFCRVFAKADPHSGKVVVLSAIDNLWKGTSSQAVQNLNVMFALPETEGLT